MTSRIRVLAACTAIFVTALLTVANEPPNNSRSARPRRELSGGQGLGTGMTPADTAAMAAQAPYMAINEQVPDALGGSSDQLAGTRLDVAHDRFYVYLKGDPTPALLALVTKASVQGIDIVIQSARFSRLELLRAANAVTALLPTGASNPGYSIDIASDGSGLTLEYAGSALPSDTARVISSGLVSGSVPITIHRDTPLDFHPAKSREDDATPFSAGGADNLGCTWAFSMYATGDASAKFMLTAAHCFDYEDGLAVKTLSGTKMGASDFVQELYNNNSYDLAVICLSSGNTNQAEMWSSDTARVAINGFASKGIPPNAITAYQPPLVRPTAMSSQVIRLLSNPLVRRTLGT